LRPESIRKSAALAIDLLIGKARNGAFVHAYDGYAVLTEAYAQRTVHLGRGILAIGAVVRPPDELHHFHTSIRAGGGGVVAEECAQCLFDRFSILLGESGLLSGLHVDGAGRLVHAEFDAMLHAHCVGTLFIGIVTSLKVD